MFTFHSYLHERLMLEDRWICRRMSFRSFQRGPGLLASGETGKWDHVGKEKEGIVSAIQSLNDAIVAEHKPE